ncbi:MAG: sulfotransferase [Myxococcota bacterium]|nr:sulfotransferase [Myxococcota bacterium]
MSDARLPDFCIIGSQKAGTSSLWHVLRQHPDLYLPEKKELNFFFLDGEFKKGLNHYSSYFREANPGQKCGEASPGYLCHPRSPERLARALPQAKLIVILRDPVQRAYSQYWDNRRWLAEGHSFAEHLRKPIHQVFKAGRTNYFSRGCYSIYLKRFLTHFKRDNLLILWFSDLKDDPHGVYKQCFRFLGIDDTVDVSAHLKPRNSRSVFKNPFYKFVFHRPRLSRLLPSFIKRLLRFGRQLPFKPEPLPDEIELRLREFYQPFDRELEKLIGQTPPWRKTTGTNSVS